MDKDEIETLPIDRREEAQYRSEVWQVLASTWDSMVDRPIMRIMGDFMAKMENSGLNGLSLAV